MSVKRYEMKTTYRGHESWDSLEEDEEGSYVDYEDYVALEKKLTDMAVQLANAESKCRELAAEISRRDAIFVPVYPDENTMNRMTDVFHDTAKIHCDEDSIFVDNAELVITAIINHYIKSEDAFLAEVRASELDSLAGVAETMLVKFSNQRCSQDMHEVVGWKMVLQQASNLAAQLRKGVQS